MLTYEQTTGKLYASSGTLLGVGYSGHGQGVNNPEMEAVPKVGPIPAGRWRIKEFLAHHEDKGPDVIVLEPVGHDAHGRDGFLMHGDNSLLNQTASEGCIIQPRPARDRSWEDPDKLIDVVAVIQPASLSTNTGIMEAAGK
jgi:Protein of unknown function (DUF2778)